jgi:hypothetical protein
MKRLSSAAAALAALTVPAHAQTQQVKPPIAVYWMSMETNAGMGMALPSSLGGLMPPGMQGGKRMKLELGSSQPASGEPRAAHAIPPGLSMGQELPLVTPRVERAPAAPSRPDEPEEVEQRFERPKARLLIYWGCGETVRAGQPVVIDFAQLDAQEAARAFRSRNVSRPRGPAPGRNRTFGEWPNPERPQPVPERSSLRGDHVVAGNYLPDMRFAIGERHDFMAPVVFEPVRKTAAGALRVKWRALPTAIGYFATAMGQGEIRDDVVMWSSSDVQEMGHALMDYVPPAQVQRLIKDKVVLPPQTTECTVPAGVFKGESSMFNFIAYGDELNLVHPPRPEDPQQVWEQQWAVKVRLKSTGMTTLADNQAGAAQPRDRSDSLEAATPSREEPGPPQHPARAPGTSDVLKEGVNILRGIFGR